MKLRHQFRGGFVDAGMIGDHPLREFLDVFRMRFGQRELAGIDIHPIGGDDDGSNLRIGGSGSLSPDDAGAQGKQGHGAHQYGFHRILQARATRGVLWLLMGLGVTTSSPVPGESFVPSARSDAVDGFRGCGCDSRLPPDGARRRQSHGSIEHRVNPRPPVFETHGNDLVRVERLDS